MYWDSIRIYGDMLNITAIIEMCRLSPLGQIEPARGAL